MGNQKAPAGFPLDRIGGADLIAGTMRVPSLPALATILLLTVLTGCVRDNKHHLLISATDQKMVVLREGQLLAVYPVSTSKFGLGDQPGSNSTPLGKLRIRKKIGDGVPSGAVFKSRKLTGEILPPNAPGRDPIVTRILWLEGLESQNKNAYDRYIYIHGTPEESTIGTAASYGCIRMRSRDVIELFDTVGTGARVTIQRDPFPRLAPSSN